MDNEPRADRNIHRIMQLLAEKKVKDGIYTGPIEMMHRGLAVTQEISGNAINHFTAQVVPSNLKVRNFSNAGIVSLSKKKKTRETLRQKSRRLQHPIHFKAKCSITLL